MQQKQCSPLSVMSICAPPDQPYLARWEHHLRPLEQAGHLTLWSEQHLLAGASRQQIDEHLEQADLLVLLLSADFFASDDCIALMERALHQNGSLRIFPLLLRSVAWRESPLASLSCLPANGRPVTQWSDADTAFDECVRDIRRLIGRPTTAPLSHRSPASAIEQQNRTRMLQRLRLTYGDVLAHSLQGTAWLELGLAFKPDAVHNAGRLLLRTSSQPERLLPAGTSIVEAYEQANHELLILGEPGTGKSTLLLHLALHLAKQSEQDTTFPLPVIFPLSTWAVKRPALEAWLAEQLRRVYQVPRALAQQWVRQEQILPLLDGLDEMEEQARPACIAAINTYHQSHLHPLVVCSRRSEYEVAVIHEHLTLQSAVVVQPLTEQQVKDHLVQAGRPFAALRSALKNNPTLMALATTPLLLQILMLTYQGTLVRDLPSKEAEMQQQIWTDYVERMIERKGDANRYPLQPTLRWLGWLAWQMREHNQTIFYLEQLQLDWLPKRQRSFYQWSTGLVSSLACGAVIGLLFGLFFGLPSGLVGCLSFGLSIGLIFGLGTNIEPAEVLTWSWEKLWSGLPVGLCVGLILGLEGGLLGGLIGGLLFRLFGGDFNVLGGLSVGLCVGLSFGLVGGPLETLSGKQLAERHMLSPNKGMRRSMKNGLLFGLVGGPIIGLIVGLLFGSFFGLVGGGLSFGLVIGLLFGLLGGLIGGLIVGLSAGLSAATKHYILRFWLCRMHLFPWKAVPFLDDTTTRILLRRVGGGYSLTHRLLLDHLADTMESNATASSAASVTSSQRSASNGQ